MNIVEEIKKEYGDIHQYKDVRNCWRSDRKIMAGGFMVRVFKILSGGERLLMIVARDFFDEDLCDTMLALVDEMDVASVCADKPVHIIEGLQYESYDFDCVAVVHHEVHNYFAVSNKNLNKVTYIAAPVARCELSGKEDTISARAIIKKIFSFVEWKREIVPKVLGRYKMETKSDKNFKLFNSSSDLFGKIGFLEEFTEGKKFYLDIKNYKDEFCHIIKKQGRFTISGEQDEIYLENGALDETEKWLKHYLYHGL